MTTEEKAKRFDEVVEEFRGLLEGVHEDKCDIMEEDILKIVPELKESEGERIRKELLEHCKNQAKPYIQTGNKCPQIQSWIDWLEKQETIDVLDKEEREFADNVDSYRKDMDEFYKKGYNAGREAEKQYWLEKQSEQKPDDKVEPKFKVGDWVVSNLDGMARQISEVHFDEYNSYYVVDGKSVNLEEYDRLHHLWTIEDAKDGDVLVDEDNNIGIYKEIEGDDWYSYTYLGCDNCIYGGGFHAQNNTKPATKEQCGLLFQKMKEAGYEWNAEEKELKKIHVIDESKTEMDYCFTKMMNDEKVSSDCSEEDEIEFNHILKTLTSVAKEQEIKGYNNLINSINWFKSLKDRVQSHWKPSEEQMKSLSLATQCMYAEEDIKNIDSLYEQLKKL